jgi:ATP-dependent exoDNAse (exonuclease V) beta subunit
MTVLRDVSARHLALTARGTSLLVEAGAGSGKTALMAGRVALLLADGEEPGSIAAITFTEAAAAELGDRVQRFVQELLVGTVDPALEPALPDGPSAAQRAHLEGAASRLDDLTCTTIHGFARDLVRPYPVEANVDPGARVLDAAEGDLSFDDTFDAWLRGRLQDDRPQGDVIVTLVTLAHDERAKVVRWLHDLAGALRTTPRLSVETHGDIGAALARYTTAVQTFAATVQDHDFAPADALAFVTAHADIARCWEALAATPTALAISVAMQRPTQVFTTSGSVRKYRVKTKWCDAARAAGRSRAAGEEANALSSRAFDALALALEALVCAAADHLLARALDAVREVDAAYRSRKRTAALLDFDDLLETAARLLAQHEDVREALAARYRHVLVDEFQDTDPLQAEIVWRLTGDPIQPDDPWQEWPARPGARFVVGDPKQSIYLFRRADVATYLQLREQMRVDPGAEIIEIKTNFRSVPGVLEHTNRTFETLLSADDQPGYTALDAFREATGRPAVCLLPVPAPPGVETVNADAARRAEAEAVAAFCDRLLGDDTFIGRRVAPGEIALLAPSGTGLWMYERELERRGIAVASQAGKGFYRRQEIQDLVALTRALADPGDRLAFGALLRGPLVGATDEELLDAAETLAEQPDGGRTLSVFTGPEPLAAGTVRRALERIGPLARRANGTTPHALLAQALERFEVRAVVLARHRGNADRALANLDLFLERSRAYAVRGLRAFARDVWAEWADEQRTVEGHPDADHDAVTLVTIHSAKGLEWPVVIPVNMLGAPRAATSPFVGRDGRIADRVLGCQTSGFGEAKELAERAGDAENVRLWYVAATRACDLLVLPDPAFPLREGAWLTIVARAEAADPTVQPLERTARARAPERADAAQSAEAFRDEAAAIAARTPSLTWRAPSRHEGVTPALDLDEATILGDPDDVHAPLPEAAAEVSAVEGAGAVRGLVLHKLLEELITDRHESDHERLRARAVTLLGELDGSPSAIDPSEVASTALRAWTRPEVAALHDRLVAELDVAGHSQDGATTVLWAGVADAVALDAEGRPEIVVDWKSDVNPSQAAVDHYRAQVGAYLELLGAPEGLVVFATTGRVEWVMKELRQV